MKAINKTEALFSDSELAKCVPLGKRLSEVGSEFGRFLEFCKKTGGLVTPSQAAYILGVTRARVDQLLVHGKIQRYVCFGKSYCSCREIDKRLSDRVKDIALASGENSKALISVYKSSKIDGRESVQVS